MRPQTLLLLLALLVTPLAARADALAPFVASYEAWYDGRHAGEATLQVTRQQAPNWQVQLDIRANRGLAGLARLNMHQSTVFDVYDHLYRPLRQDTRRRAIVFGRTTTGTYDWHAMQAQWRGDVSERRSAPVALRHGDMSALLINLAVIRDAVPGQDLHYRYVDNGRAREHTYSVAQAPEIVEVGDMSYNALRITRADDDGDTMMVWVADGVPTPVRILQRDADGGGLDLRLIQYEGAD